MGLLHHLTGSSEQCSKTVAQVARDLDLTESALGLWVKRARADRTKGKTGLTIAERGDRNLLGA